MFVVVADHVSPVDIRNGRHHLSVVDAVVAGNDIVRHVPLDGRRQFLHGVAVVVAAAVVFVVVTGRRRCEKTFHHTCAS